MFERFDRAEKLMMSVRSLKWQATTTAAARPLPPLAGFFEEQLWALQDRADALRAVPLQAPMAARLSVAIREVAEAIHRLRAPHRSNRAGMPDLIDRLRKTFEMLERHAWPDLTVV